MGFATEDTEGTEAIRVSQVYSVVSVILCGLSCPCVLFILSVGVRLALGGMATQSVAMGRRTPPCIARTCPRERGHDTRLYGGYASAGRVDCVHAVFITYRK